MIRENTLKTMMIWHDSTGSECEAEVYITYVVDPGYAGDRINPPEPASVEIIGVSSVIADYDIPEYAIDHDTLSEACMADWRDEQIAGEEYRAEQRAEMLRSER